MLCAAADLKLFGGSQIEHICYTLRFKYKIQLFLTILHPQYSAQIVCACWGFYLEPIRDLEEHLHIWIIIKRHRKRLLYN